nr:hypothetical protein [uncultured Agathobacter sp.]
MNSVSVNIVMTYPVHWTKYQVLRDFVQNFYDAVGYNDWRQRFCYEYENSVLSMWIENVSFNYEWLMHIGASTKTGQSKGYAGFFGEGFKIASLCGFRDWGWGIQMMSGDWHIDVTEMDQLIDQTHVKMLAYNISSVHKAEETRLVLNNITLSDYELFKTVLDSFFSADNPIMGEKIWIGDEGAVFLRSMAEINSNLPMTSEFGRRGAVFCGYQMLGTNPFDLVVCLHKYRKDDRERRSLYTFNVIEVFEEICRYIDPACAMIMLEKMRRYWNSYPHKRIDINSWSRTIDMLIRKVSGSKEVRMAFFSKYNNLLTLKRLHTISENNRRWQARAWLKQQNKKYILVKDSFSLIGYPQLEEECEKNGGFVVDDNVDRVQNCCFIILEDVCRDVFKGFFETEELPERKIITNPRAAYHGMAVTYKKRQSKLNKKGLTIRYDIGKIFLKSEVFRPEGYYDALSTYVHEMCHMFGGDASASFSQALTFATELLLENHERVTKGKIKWNQTFAAEKILNEI